MTINIHEKLPKSWPFLRHNLHYLKNNDSHLLPASLFAQEEHHCQPFAFHAALITFCR